MSNIGDIVFVDAVDARAIEIKRHDLYTATAVLLNYVVCEDENPRIAKIVDPRNLQQITAFAYLFNITHNRYENVAISVTDPATLLAVRNLFSADIKYTWKLVPRSVVCARRALFGDILDNYLIDAPVINSGDYDEDDLCCHVSARNTFSLRRLVKAFSYG